MANACSSLGLKAMGTNMGASVGTGGGAPADGFSQMLIPRLRRPLPRRMENPRRSLMTIWASDFSTKYKYIVESNYPLIYPGIDVRVLPYMACPGNPEWGPGQLKSKQTGAREGVTQNFRSLS